MGRTPNDGVASPHPARATTQTKEAIQMPKVSKDSAPQRQEAGPVADLRDELDGYTVSFTSLVEDIDATPLMKGLPDDRCQCPHWGYVFKGKMTARYADHDEVFEAGGVSSARLGPHRRRSGRAAFGARCAERPDRDLPSAFDVGRPRFQRDHVRLRQAKLAASSIAIRRSEGSAKDERTLSNVVFPEPVPPDTMMFMRARTQSANRSMSVRGSRRLASRAGPRYARLDEGP